MAVRIPIVTVFDSKGLKQAQYQLNKVRGNFQNLGRNFAIAGAAFAGAAAIIGKSARDLARIESINAQTAQTIKSMGNAANVSAGQVEQLAGRLEAMTATEAEAIQEGANLLLTFGNITNQLGKGNDIFTQTTEIMLDMGRALKKGPVDTATMLGKALNDPIQGMTALRRVGVSFTEQQVEQVKALQKSGDLMGAQKLILAELQNQYGGSGAAYAATFAGQVELLNHELGALGEEATLAVMPALRDLVAALRELAPEIGTKLKAAIASVDWKAFAKTLTDIITFLVQNAETIMKVVGAMFALNTIYNAGRVAVGLYSAATVILGNTFTVTAGKIGLATGALKLFRIALATTGIGAILLLLGTAAENMANVKQKTDLTTDSVNTYRDSLSQIPAATGYLGNHINQINGVQTAWTNAANAANNYRPPIAPGRSSVLDSYNYNVRTGQPVPTGGVQVPNLAAITAGTGGGASSSGSNFATTLKQSVLEQNRQNKLVATGLTVGAAQLALSTVSNKKQFQKLQATLSKPGVADKRQAQFNRTAAGLAEVASAAAAANAAAEAAAQQAAAAAAAAAQAAAEQAAREAAILAEKQRVYESFANSITSTFARIQESILGAFSLPELGGSTDSIIRNMDKLLNRVKAFSGNITKLSSMGLDPKLLQQVINAGPIAGAKLAANLVSGGVGGLTAINKGYSELGSLASEIGLTGTQAQFANATQQQIININIEGGLDSSAAIGKAVVDAVRAYERTSGAVWQGA
jgi:hypothetical protein